MNYKRTCTVCGKKLSEFQVEYCSTYCRQKSWQLKNRTKPNQNKREKELDKKYNGSKPITKKVLLDTNDKENNVLKNTVREKGVYIFFNEGKPIYVGSSTNLNRRLNTYFTSHICRTSIFYQLWQLKYKKLYLSKFYAEDFKEMEEWLILKLKPKYNSTLQKNEFTIQRMMKEIKNSKFI